MTSSAEPQRCALPGCDVPIETPEDGSAPRKYCCTEHRFAARRLRSTARAGKQITPSEPVDKDARTKSAVDPDAAWQRRVRAAIDRAIRSIATVMPTDNGLFDPSGVTGPSATTPVERVIKELTHTIDASVIATTSRRRRPRRPSRKPVAHKSATRKPSARKPAARRASALRNPTRRRPVTAAQRRLRTRAGVVAATIAFVATGAWLVTMHPWTSQAPSVSQAQLPQAPQVPALPANGDKWAANAQFALTSVDQQLAEATKAEQAWQSTPAAQHQSAEPPAVTELHKQISALQREHDQLQTALNTWRAATQAHDALAAANAQYSAMVQPSTSATRPIAGPREPTPTTTPNTPTQNAAGQEQTLASKAATQRGQLDSLLPQVQSNMAAPLPATVDNIGALADSVLGLTHRQPAPSKPPTPAPSTTKAPQPTATKPPTITPTRASTPPAVAATHPAPAQPTPAHPVPTHPAPAQPVPTHPVPAQPAPAQPAPGQPAPPQPAPAKPALAQPAPGLPAPAQPAPVTLVPVLMPTHLAPVATRPTPPTPVMPTAQPTQPTPTTATVPMSQSETDTLAALRDLEAMSTLAAAAQQAPEGSEEKRRLTEEAASGITQVMANHLGSLLADAAAVDVNSSGDSYGANGANAGG